MKLDLTPDDGDDHRRVKAVLMWLDHLSQTTASPARPRVRAGAAGM